MTAMRSHRPSSSGQVAADHEDRARRAAGRVSDERVDEPVDLRLASDVDAARRLVEHEDVDVVVKQAADGDLLLVAARQLARLLRRPGALDRRARRSSARPRPAGGRRTGAPPDRTATACSSSGCRRCRASSASPSSLRSSLRSPMPCAPPLVRVAPGRCRRRRGHGRFAPARGRTASAAGASGRIRARPAMPKISPRWSAKDAEPGSSAVTSRMASPRRARRPGKQIADGPTDHQRDDVVVRGVLRRAAAGVAAVTQHDEPIGDALHFLDEVRDVDDRVPLRLEVCGASANRCSTSARPRLLVGSSSTSTRQPTAIARAISTSCCAATDRLPTVASGGMSS